MDRIARRVREAMQRFDIPCAYIATSDGADIRLLGDINALEYPNFPNTFFDSEESVRNLNVHLKVNICPRMWNQGRVKGVMGYADKKKDIIYAIFMNSDESVKEQYFFSKEVDKFINQV